MFQKTFVIKGVIFFFFFFLKWRVDTKTLLENYYYFSDLLGGSYLFEILHTSSTMKISKNVVKTGCFQRFKLYPLLKNVKSLQKVTSQWRAPTFFLNEVGYKVFYVKILMCSILLEDWYLFEILHTSSNVKISKNVVKSGCV